MQRLKPIFAAFSILFLVGVNLLPLVALAGGNGCRCTAATTVCCMGTPEAPSCGMEMTEVDQVPFLPIPTAPLNRIAPDDVGNSVAHLFHSTEALIAASVPGFPDDPYVPPDASPRLHPPLLI